MALDVLDQGNAIAVLIARHGEIGNQHMRIQFRQVVDQCCRVFKFADNIHPLNLLK